MRGNAALLADGETIAGSASTLMDCLRVAVQKMGVPLAAAVRCATGNPARALMCDGERGGLDPGARADVVLLDPDLAIRQVFLGGKPLF